MSKGLIALYRKFVVDRGIHLKDVPETVRQRMMEKSVQDVERDSILLKTTGNALMSTPIYETRGSWE